MTSTTCANRDSTIDNSIPVQRLQLAQEEVRASALMTLDMEPFGVPGLSFMTRNAQGWMPTNHNANEV